jgi:hypothetical protein
VQREWDPDTLDECLNIDDLEHLATKTINKKAWGYYYSASDNLYSKSYNGDVYNKILLRPRIFVDCIRYETHFLSYFPLYSSFLPFLVFTLSPSFSSTT